MTKSLTLRAIGLMLLLSSLNANGAAPPPSEAFKYFDGSWRCDGYFPSNGKKISSTMTFRWNAFTGALIKQHDDLPPHGYHAVELWAGATKNADQNIIADVSGAVRPFTSTGWSGDTLTWIRDIDSSHRERFLYARLSADSMRVDYATSANGAEFVVGDTLTCSRSKG